MRLLNWSFLLMVILCIPKGGKGKGKGEQFKGEAVTAISSLPSEPFPTNVMPSSEPIPSETPSNVPIIRVTPSSDQTTLNANP